MKIRLMKLSRIFILLSLACAFSLTAHGQQKTEEPLTNSAVIKLVRAGFKEKTVIAIIRSRPSQFDLSPDRLIELKRSSVSENIILAMIASDDMELAAGDDWTSDPFFKDSGRNKNGKSEGETNIFGMNGGSSNRTRQRGANGSSGGETETTGSATVRILRPPAEAGGAPKLERTPTLTNDSVIELVEAGFSEGTIKRRIEQSPVEFDLSPPKLAELRHRHVSDRIIAAMSDDSQAGTKPKSNTPEK